MSTKKKFKYANQEILAWDWKENKIHTMSLADYMTSAREEDITPSMHAQRFDGEWRNFRVAQVINVFNNPSPDTQNEWRAKELAYVVRTHQEGIILCTPGPVKTKITISLDMKRFR